MGLFSRFLKPVAAISEPGSVLDLDQMLEKPLRVDLHGKTHVIRQPDMRTFIEFTHEMGRIQEMQRKGSAGQEEIGEAYFRVFRAICPSLKRKDFERMTQKQVSALFTRLVRLITGVEEKKTPENPEASKT